MIQNLWVFCTQLLGISKYASVLLLGPLIAMLVHYLFITACSQESWWSTELLWASIACSTIARFSDHNSLPSHHSGVLLTPYRRYTWVYWSYKPLVLWLNGFKSWSPGHCPLLAVLHWPWGPVIMWLAKTPNRSMAHIATSVAVCVEFLFASKQIS